MAKQAVETTPMGKSDTGGPGETVPARHERIVAPVVKGSSMERWLCWGALGTAGILALVFILDLVAGFPFHRANVFLDIVAVLGSGLVIYLAWDTMRELR